MPNINNIDPFTGLGADNIVGGSGASNGIRLGGLDGTIQLVPIVTWVQPVREAHARLLVGELLSADHQSLGTSDDFSQPNPFDGDSNILIECSFEPSTLGQSDFFFF